MVENRNQKKNWKKSQRKNKKTWNEQHFIKFIRNGAIHLETKTIFCHHICIYNFVCMKCVHHKFLWLSVSLLLLLFICCVPFFRAAVNYDILLGYFECCLLFLMGFLYKTKQKKKIIPKCMNESAAYDAW